jgi:MFS family permease
VRWIVFAVVITATVTDVFDPTIVNVAAPSIRADLGGGEGTVQWLSVGYTLAFAVLLIAGARRTALRRPGGRPQPA